MVIKNKDIIKNNKKCIVCGDNCSKKWSYDNNRDI